MSIDLKYLITVEMGQQDCEIGRKVYMADPPLRLSASKHCYTAIFILCDMENEDSFFQPYYSMFRDESVFFVCTRMSKICMLLCCRNSSTKLPEYAYLLG